MKVLHLANYRSSIGGAFIDCLSSLMDKDIGEVFVFPVKRSWQEELIRKGGKVFILPVRSLFDLPAFIRLVRLIKQEKVDIIHSHYSLPVYIHSALSKIFTPPIKVIWHWRNPMGVETALFTEHVSSIFRIGYKIKRLIGNTLYRAVDSLFVDAQIAVSNGVADIIRRRKMTHKDKLKVVLNGINIEKFNPQQAKATKRDFGFKDDEFLLCKIAHFREQKDHMTLLNAFKLVLDVYPNTRLLLVGEGPLEDTIREHAQSLHVSEHVSFLGARDDTQNILYISDLSVVSSNYEGFCFFAMESLAMSTPVVSTDACGLKEVITPNKDGYLLPVRDYHSIAEKIIFLIKNPEERLKMGRFGRKKALEDFNLDVWSNNIKNIYLNLLQK